MNPVSSYRKINPHVFRCGEHILQRMASEHSFLRASSNGTRLRVGVDALTAYQNSCGSSVAFGMDLGIYSRTPVDVAVLGEEESFMYKAAAKSIEADVRSLYGRDFCYQCFDHKVAEDGEKISVDGGEHDVLLRINDIDADESELQIADLKLISKAVFLSGSKLWESITHHDSFFLYPFDFCRFSVPDMRIPENRLSVKRFVVYETFPEGGIMGINFNPEGSFSGVPFGFLELFDGVVQPVSDLKNFPFVNVGPGDHFMIGDQRFGNILRISIDGRQIL